MENREKCNQLISVQAGCQYADGAGYCYLSSAKREALTFCDNKSWSQGQAEKEETNGNISSQPG